MAARKHRGSDLRHILILDLAKVFTYGLFDMTYEGDHMEFKADDGSRAVDEIKRWSWRDDECWIGKCVGGDSCGTSEV